MDPSNSSASVPAKGTTITFGSWVLTTDSLGGFHSHLVNPNAPKTSEVSRRRGEIPLPVHVKGIREQPDFDVTPTLTKTSPELEEHLDHLLGITKLGATSDQEAPALDSDSTTNLDCEEIIPEYLDQERDQAFIDYLNELDPPDSFDDLEEWSDNINLFMQGLSNPDKIKELWEKSKTRKL